MFDNADSDRIRQRLLDSVRAAEAECLLRRQRPDLPGRGQGAGARRPYAAGSNVIGLGDTDSAGRG